MARISVLATAILLISFVSTLSDASASLRLRDLLADGPVKDAKPDSQKDSSVPPPGIQPKGGDSKPDEKPPPPSDPKKPKDPPSPPPQEQAGKPNPVNPAVPPPPPAGSGTIPKGSSSPPPPKGSSNPPPPKGSSNPPPQSPSPKPHNKTPPPPPPPPAPIEEDNKASPGSDGKDHGKNKEDEKGSGDKFQKGVCKGLTINCTVADHLVGCLRYRGTDSKGSSIFVENTGTSNLTVHIVAPASIKIDRNKLRPELSKQQNEEIDFFTNTMESLEIILSTEKGNCTLKTRSFSWNIENLPAYATNAAQIYGVYILIFTILIAGGTWACCKFVRKRRRMHAGVPYQQLEMGAQTQISSAEMHGSTADGWEQGWDDDWDDEEAVVTSSSDKHPTGNASSNGLTSRSTNKDGWEDWDD